MHKDTGYIEIEGNRVNNLKNINLRIPRGKLVVVSGVSGSGKSSIAFDTLYAEGQRRYVESLSSYARQFLERMPKPECNFIRYIPPAVAIQQRVISRNPRSTVGTSTELYDYFKMLFARFGKTISPISHTEVKKHTPADVVAQVKTYPEGTKLFLLAPLPESSSPLKERLELYQSAGFTRLWSPLLGVQRIEEYPATQSAEELYLVIDRFSAQKDNDDLMTRLADSAEIAFYEGHGVCRLMPQDHTFADYTFSTRFEQDGIVFAEPTPELFDFNNASGACPECEGYGRVIGIAEDLVIPDPSLSLYDGAIACWIGPNSSLWAKEFMRCVAKQNYPIHTPYEELSETDKDLLWQGVYNPKKDCKVGIYPYFAMLKREGYKIQNRVRISRFSGKTKCPSCQGKRLRKEALYVQVNQRTIAEVTNMTIREALNFFENLSFTPEEEKAAERILFEIRTRLRVLSDVGVEYLTLNRPSNTLSGGESQRINLSTRLASNLYGALYILDEPSIGLHERDTERLISVVQRLRDAGNSIVVVEHDERMIRSADLIVDIGPEAGIHGGEVVFMGAPSEITQQTAGYTAAYLSGRLSIPIPKKRRIPQKWISVKNASKHNLKKINVSFPLNVLTVVTGISGSGKSTLVEDIMYKGMEQFLDDGTTGLLYGDLKEIKELQYVDQNMAARNARSNPATFVKAYDDIRDLYSQQPLSRQMNYPPHFFSFNREGGRCPECKGEGSLSIEMQFMADLVLPCDACEGKRFKREILQVEYHGMNIFQILSMTVAEAVAFFQEHPMLPYTASITDKLRVLEEVGLGYIPIGQSCATLSGGENQRLKLASHLLDTRADTTLFIFDEPTTGLHSHDINKLLTALQALVKKGHTVWVIEHNLDVIKCADYVIDLGPEGGENGGELMAVGTPEEVSQSPKSITGYYLKQVL